MPVLDEIDWAATRRHYDRRKKLMADLSLLLDSQEDRKFLRLFLGISDKTGNYSSWEHDLGPKILNSNPNAEARVIKLATSLKHVTSYTEVAPIIRAASLKYLKIGVGSEGSFMLNSNICHVSNTRTIWTHLVYKHKGELKKANEELKLYRDHDDDSEMAYRKWTKLHAEMAKYLEIIDHDGRREALKSGVKPGLSQNIWVDSVCNALYSLHHDT